MEHTRSVTGKERASLPRDPPNPLIANRKCNEADVGYTIKWIIPRQT